MHRLTIECQERQGELNPRKHTQEEEVESLQSLEHLQTLCDSLSCRSLSGTIRLAVDSSFGRAIHSRFLCCFAARLRESEDKENRLQGKEDESQCSWPRVNIQLEP